MKFYEVSFGDSDHPTHFVDKASAIREAKATGNEFVSVDQITIGPVTKDLIRRMLDGKGYVRSRVQVWPKPAE